MEVEDRTALGLGIGWRPATAELVLNRRDIGFVEVIAESMPANRTLPAPLEEARRRGVLVVPHGIGLSLGSAARPNRRRLAALATLADRVGAPLVSEHVAFVRAGRREVGHLLPVPRTRQMVSILCENIRIAQDALPVPLAVEHPASLFEWPDPDLDEAQFLSELVAGTGCQLVVDVANAYVNGRNHGYDPLEFLGRLPVEHVAYVHAAGGVEADGVYHDSHAHPLWPAVPTLVEALAARTTLPGVLLERDDDFPPVTELSSELDALAQAWQRGEQHRIKPPDHEPDQRPSTPLSTSSDRAQVAAAQRRLVDTLLTAAPPPPGFDPDRLSITATALRRKRLRNVINISPALAAQLGDRLEPAFLEWSQTTPPPRRGGGQADGRRFLASLRRRSANPGPLAMRRGARRATRHHR